MTLLELVIAGGTVELVFASWIAGALAVGGWAYRRGLAEGRAEVQGDTVLPTKARTHG